MAYLDSNWSHFKYSIDKVDHGGYGAEHIFIGYEEKPLLSVHQQFSALATMGHPWRITDAHFTGVGSVVLGETDKGLLCYGCILKLPGDFNVWWGLRSTALNCASFVPKFFRLWRMSGLKPLHPIQTDNLPQALTSPASSVLIPGSGPVISICKARCSRAAERAQHSHLGYWSHSTLVALALTNLIPSLLEYLLCLIHSCPENVPGVSSPGPVSISSVPFPLPLLSCPPASSESLYRGDSTLFPTHWDICHPLPSPPEVSNSLPIPFPGPRFSRSLVPPAWLLSAHPLPPPPSAWPTFPPLVLNPSLPNPYQRTSSPSSCNIMRLWAHACRYSSLHPGISTCPGKRNYCLFLFGSLSSYLYFSFYFLLVSCFFFCSRPAVPRGENRKSINSKANAPLNHYKGYLIHCPWLLLGVWTGLQSQGRKLLQDVWFQVQVSLAVSCAELAWSFCDCCFSKSPEVSLVTVSPAVLLGGLAEPMAEKLIISMLFCISLQLLSPESKFSDK